MLHARGKTKRQEEKSTNEPALSNLHFIFFFLFWLPVCSCATLPLSTYPPSLAVVSVLVLFPLPFAPTCSSWLLSVRRCSCVRVYRYFSGYLFFSLSRVHTNTARSLTSTCSRCFLSFSVSPSPSSTHTPTRTHEVRAFLCPLSCTRTRSHSPSYSARKQASEKGSNERECVCLYRKIYSDIALPHSYPCLFLSLCVCTDLQLLPASLLSVAAHSLSVCLSASLLL